MLQQRVLDVLAQVSLREFPSRRRARSARPGGACDRPDAVPDIGRGDPQEPERDPRLPDAPPTERGAGQETGRGPERAGALLELLRVHGRADNWHQSNPGAAELLLREETKPNGTGTDLIAVGAPRGVCNVYI